MRVTFDTSKLVPELGADGAQPMRFDAPIEVIAAETAAQVPAAFERLAAAQSAGHWVAGYARYELGYALEPVLAELMPTGHGPLMQFGVYATPTAAQIPQPGGALYDMVPVWARDEYAAAFDRIQNYISAGDIYQANLTFAIEGRYSGVPDGIYGALARSGQEAFGALVELADRAFLSRSPELFFATDGAGNIKTRPMKGTAPRGETPEIDAQNRAFLAADAKNRAENLMIVDLLRNDLSRISQVGTVKVPELFTLETYETVHQMVSEVQGKLMPGVGLPEIFRAIFPCGSITGAPKIRAMQVIAELETAPRGIYCGTIGWAAPDGRSQFNVAIRTLELAHGRARLNVGGGIVHDSTAMAEYDEALWKARFVAGVADDAP